MSDSEPFFCCFFFSFLTRSVWCHFHPCSLEVKTALEMCLYAAIYHLTIPSGFVLSGSYWHEGAGLPALPIGTTGTHWAAMAAETESGTSELPSSSIWPFQGARAPAELRHVSLPSNAGVGSRHPAGAKLEPSAPSTLQTHPLPLPAQAAGRRWPASPIHQRQAGGHFIQTHPGHTYHPIYTMANSMEKVNCIKKPRYPGTSNKGIGPHLWHGTTWIAGRWFLTSPNIQISKQMNLL